MIFKYRTCIPLVVKYGISNLTLIGLFALLPPETPPMEPPKPPIMPPPLSSSPLCYTHISQHALAIEVSYSPNNLNSRRLECMTYRTEGKPNSALIKNSFPPPNCLIFHTISLLSGA